MSPTELIISQFFEEFFQWVQKIVYGAVKLSKSFVLRYSHVPEIISKQLLPIPHTVSSQYSFLHYPSLRKSCRNRKPADNNPFRTSIKTVRNQETHRCPLYYLNQGQSPSEVRRLVFTSISDNKTKRAPPRASHRIILLLLQRPEAPERREEPGEVSAAPLRDLRLGFTPDHRRNGRHLGFGTGKLGFSSTQIRRQHLLVLRWVKEIKRGSAVKFRFEERKMVPGAKKKWVTGLWWEGKTMEPIAK